mmetsp:Transcript_14927/g.36515  ORF Transcript_14927/g.36515 Transcript_14927/m.36515 type:complete len:207 (-) Transcript_14927:64-684(-)
MIESIPRKPRMKRKPAAHGRVHDHTAHMMKKTSTAVMRTAGKRTPREHSATAGVRMRRLQSKSPKQSQFQKHFSYTSRELWTVKKTKSMPMPVPKGLRVIHWLSLAACARSFPSKPRPRESAMARSRPRRCMTAVSSTKRMTPMEKRSSGTWRVSTSATSVSSSSSVGPSAHRCASTSSQPVNLSSSSPSVSFSMRCTSFWKWILG